MASDNQARFWVDQPQHECAFSKSELRQIYHGVEFALINFDKSVKECGANHPMAILEQGLTRTNMQMLMAKALKLYNDIEAAE